MVLISYAKKPAINVHAGVSSIRKCSVGQHFCNHLEEEDKAGSFAAIVLHMYCYYTGSMALPHGAMGWSAVCDCVFSDHTHLLLDSKIKDFPSTQKLAR